MSYKVVKTVRGYEILETKTETRIHLGPDEQKAKDLCRKMNLGSGFNGWTPQFIAERHLVS